MITKYVGTCQSCEGEQKLHDGLLVFHGYRRPGDGYTMGRCPGTDRQPLEVAHDLVDARAAQLRSAIPAAENVVRELESGEAVSLTRYDRVYDRKTYTYVFKQVEFIRSEMPPYKWQEELERTIQKAKADVEKLQYSLERTERILRNWEPRPLKTVREFESAKTAASDEVKLAKAKAKAEKLAKAAERKAKAEALEAKRHALMLSYRDQFLVLAAQPASRERNVAARNLAFKYRDDKRFGSGFSYMSSKMQIEDALRELGLRDTYSPSF